MVGGAGGPVTETPAIHYSPLVASYNGGWLEHGGSTTISGIWTLGMRGVLGNSEDQFAAKRSGASADFSTFRGSVQQTETYQRWTLSGKLEMQLASGPLVPNEQYAAGGAETVRGYRESEMIGDDALRLGLELLTPSLTLAESTAMPLRVSGLGFVEGAQLRIRQPVYPQSDHALMRGAGFGVRVTAPKGVSFDLDWARAFDDAQVTKAGDTRLYSRMAWDF